MSTRMMKDATGTALMAAMAGARRSRTESRKAAEREAKQGAAQGCQEETAYDPERRGDGTPEIRTGRRGR